MFHVKRGGLVGLKTGGEVMDTYDKNAGVLCALVKTGPRRIQEVDLERTAVTRSISPGDQLWWYRDRAFWTPRSRAFRHKLVKRLLKRSSNTKEPEPCR
jgi:hypothetical protein